MQKQAKKTKENLRDERGITLVALVVTVIILLILGGITIGAINGDDGVISQTLNSKKQSDMQNGIEIIKAAITEAHTLKPNSKMQASDIKEALSGYDVEVSPRGNNYKITLNGTDYRILSDGEVIQYDYMKPTDIIYLKLYEDGTLIFSSKENTTYQDYYGNDVVVPKLVGTYSTSECWDNVFPNAEVKTVVFYDKIAPKTCLRMFYNCTNLTAIENIENLHMENSGDMASMFNGCSKIQNIDVKLFETGQVTDMSSVFRLCQNLKKINLNNFSTNKVKSMGSMFDACYVLENIDVSNFDTSQVTSMNRMFAECRKIEKLNLTNFNTSNVKNMGIMFYNCKNLTNIDVRSFDTSKATNMQYMFGYCSSLSELDISNFDTTLVTNFGNMFLSCNKLKRINTSDKFIVGNEATTTNMFYRCNSIVGGLGTTYDANYIDGTYAREDNPPDEPGYFTLKK